ncbi:MAG: FliO/MopB family protein [Planctomycetota bacterium]|jgi:flagellar biogenesis protein FliO
MHPWIPSIFGLAATASAALGGPPGEDEFRPTGQDPTGYGQDTVDGEPGPGEESADALSPSAASQGRSVAGREFTRNSSAKVRAVKRDNSTPATMTESPTDSFSTLGALFIVLAVMAVAYVVIKRFVPGAQHGDNDALRVIARAAISPKQSVALISLGRRMVMVGISSERISVLSEVTDEKEAAEIAFLAGAGLPRAKGKFDKILSRESEEFVSEQGSATGAESKGRERGLTDLLNRLRSMQS